MSFIFDDFLFHQRLVKYDEIRCISRIFDDQDSCNQILVVVWARLEPVVFHLGILVRRRLSLYFVNLLAFVRFPSNWDLFFFLRNFEAYLKV